MNDDMYQDYFELFLHEKPGENPRFILEQNSYADPFHDAMWHCWKSAIRHMREHDNKQEDDDIFQGTKDQLNALSIRPKE